MIGIKKYTKNIKIVNIKNQNTNLLISITSLNRSKKSDPNKNIGIKNKPAIIK